MSELITVKIEDGVAIITIDHPPLNVLNKKVQQELVETFSMLKEDKEVVCVILETAGDKAFIAGADIKEFPSMFGDSNMLENVMEMHDLMNEIDQFPKPTIVVLDGVTFGGGCELALAFDIRIAEEQATIALPEVKLGIFPGAGGTQRLPRLIGEARAKEMMFTGEAVGATEAERIGLVNRVTPTGEGLASARTLAAQITNKSLQSLSRIKKAVDEGMDTTLEVGIQREAELFTEIFQTEDVLEGISAFIEKRKPVFKHK
ncbi:enoyl-CoA hydratase [Aquibacillus halophilus]|nr:enoyl-CoA hydratase [Aquibacillus halophilus]